MTEDKHTVEAAYALETPEDSKRLYATWAKTYDESFAQANDFLMPAHVARLFLELGGTGPVLDAGAGTGLVGEAFSAQGGPVVDALDITPEMLQVAAGKGVYRHCIEADLTRDLPLAHGIYSGVVSSGTFTHGHVGPEALHELLRVASSGALFVLSIKKDHFEERGFRAAFDGFGPAISGFERVTLPIYGTEMDQDPENLQGLVVIFRKT